MARCLKRSRYIIFHLSLSLWLAIHAQKETWHIKNTTVCFGQLTVPFGANLWQISLHHTWLCERERGHELHVLYIYTTFRIQIIIFQIFIMTDFFFNFLLNLFVSVAQQYLFTIVCYQFASLNHLNDF